MFDPFSLFAAFAPVAVDAAKAAVNRWITPEKIKPMSVADAIALEQVDIDRLKTIAELDRPSEKVSPWVSDVRALMRPVIAITVTVAAVVAPESPNLMIAAQCVWFYLFGERTLRK